VKTILTEVQSATFSFTTYTNYNSELCGVPIKMDNNQYRPFVTIYCDIVDNKDEENDSDTTVELSPVTPTSPSPPALSPIFEPSAINDEVSNEIPLYMPPYYSLTDEITDETTELPSKKEINVCKKLAYDCIKTRYMQDATRYRHLHNERAAIIELDKNLLTIRLINVPREILRNFLEMQLPLPAPTGEENFLNTIFDGGITLLHSSAKQLSYDIIDLILVHGADTDIKEDGKTVAHRAAETNDTLLIRVLYRHKANFSKLDDNGETALMVAMALGNKAVTRLLQKTDSINTTSANDESILHYAAKYNNLILAKRGCERGKKININMRSRHESRTALHIAVQMSHVGVTRLLLKHGARDEWEDHLGKYAKDYIRDEEVKLLFIWHKMLEPSTAPTSQPTATTASAELNTNEPTTQEPPTRRRAAFMTAEENQFTPSKKGKFSSSTKKKGQDTSTTGNELQQQPTDDTDPQPGPSRTTYDSERLDDPENISPTTTLTLKYRPEISENGGNTNFSQIEPQYNGSSDNDYPILTSILINNPLTNDNQPHTQGTCNTHVLYDPKLWDGTTIPKPTLRGFGSECRWKNCCPLEPQRPENYIRPELEQLAPKMDYPINAYCDYASHLLHLNMQYSWRVGLANRPRYQRDLYEMYVWERSNIYCSFRNFQAKQQLPTFTAGRKKIRFGPSC